MVGGPADPLYGTSLGVNGSYLNPTPSMFSDPTPQWNGYLTDTPVGGVFVGGNSAEPAAPQTVRAGDYGGSMERIARAQLGANASQREINNYVGQLFELNSVDARRIGADMQIALPSGGTPMATDGLKQYGQDIARGEQIKAAQAEAAQRATDSAAYREAQRFAGFAADNQSYAAQQQAFGRENARLAAVPNTMAAEVPVYDAMGNYTGTTAQVSTAAPTMSYGEQMSHVGDAVVDMGKGALKGVVTGIPEMATAAVKGWAYIGAGLGELTGLAPEGALARTVNRLDAVTGRVIEYNNGFERVGGIAGEFASPSD